jgi:oligoribonuclease NrnB/cAMP/cGMP phosphodiesterase (DHH superfamily)
MTIQFRHNQVLCIYHANCADGFAAAFAMYLWDEKHSASVEYHEGVYQQDPPFHKCVGKDIYIVDFSYPPDVISEMAKIANKVVIIDHHVSAMKAWQKKFPQLNGLDVVKFKEGNIEINFDMRMSGAVLTWNYFHRDTVPLMFRYVQDMDLWLKEMPGTEPYIMALRSYPMDFIVWKALMGFEKKLVEEGHAINRWYQQQIEILKPNTKRMAIGGFMVPVVNANYCFASALAGALAQNEPFAASYFHDGNRYNFSLRSREGGVDVSEVAKQYGGGGHKQAAGFAVKELTFLTFEAATK